MSQTIDIRELNERIESKSSFVNMITMGMDKVIVGQKHLVESLLIGLLSDGHILLEGVPGLAKTLAIKTLSSLIDAKYSRIRQQIRRKLDTAIFGVNQRRQCLNG